MSVSASNTSWLTERSLEKAMCEASPWIPLTSFAAHVSTGVMLAPCWCKLTAYRIPVTMQALQ